MLVIFVENGRRATDLLDDMEQVDLHDNDDGEPDEDAPGVPSEGTESVPEGMNLAETSLGVIP